MVRFTARPHSGIPIREEEGSVEASTPTAYIPKAEAKPPSSTQNASTTTFELSAEMATALRNQTTTLIHLREKMGLQSNDFGEYTIFSNQIYGGDLDEMIDFQIIKSRDI